jgi:hypothetical protein
MWAGKTKPGLRRNSKHDLSAVAKTKSKSKSKFSKFPNTQKD